VFADFPWITPEETRAAEDISDAARTIDCGSDEMAGLPMHNLPANASAAQDIRHQEVATGEAFV
jgi:hypothetical protein